MLYAFGTGGASVAGLTSIVFAPNAQGGYDWISN